MHICHYRNVISYFYLLEYLRIKHQNKRGEKRRKTFNKDKIALSSTKFGDLDKAIYMLNKHTKCILLYQCLCQWLLKVINNSFLRKTWNFTSISIVSFSFGTARGDMASDQEYKGWKMSANVSREDYFGGVFSWGINSQE